MSLKNILPALLAALLFANCQKIEIDPDFTATPVFSVDLNIDGEAKSFIAGESDYYQFTGKTSDNGIYEFYGDLKQENCTDDCEASLKITFRGTNDNAIDLFSNNSSFKYKALNPAGTARARVSLDAIPFGEPPYNHVWEFEDQPNQTGDHVEVEFDDLDLQRIKLTTTDGLGCENVSERELDLSNIAPGSSGCPEYIFFVQPLDSSSLDPYFFIFINSPFGGNPDWIMWNDSTVGNVNCFHIDSTYGEICATVYEQSCVEEFCMTISGDSSSQTSPSSICATQFTSMEEFVFVPGDTLQLETVLVEYTDESGMIFNSEITPQEANAFFNIQNFESYDPNENGKPTVKIDFDFSCKIASSSGEVLRIESANGVFAVEK